MTRNDLMMIETEDTPNPATLKFLPGRDVTGDRSPVDFAEAGVVAGRSALADALFGMSDVRRVFLGSDFVSVTKDDGADWETLRPQVLVALTDFFRAGSLFWRKTFGSGGRHLARGRGDREPCEGAARHVGAACRGQ